MYTHTKLLEWDIGDQKYGEDFTVQLLSRTEYVRILGSHFLRVEKVTGIGRASLTGIAFCFYTNIVQI